MVIYRNAHPEFHKPNTTDIMEFLMQHDPSPLQFLTARNGVSLWIKRDDLLPFNNDDAFCGNKCRKLKYNLLEAKAHYFQNLLTFGGAYSNHIAAVASAGAQFGFSTIGVIRGEAHSPLNPTLQKAQSNGMTLTYLDRQSYRQKSTEAFQEQLRKTYGPETYIIPEGGTNKLALLGCQEMALELLNQCKVEPDFICLSVGTGGTMAGVVQGLKGRCKVLGFPALKGSFLQDELHKWIGDQHTNWSLVNDYHFGGYAKYDDQLLAFIKHFRTQYDVALDPIYTAKMCYGVIDLIDQGYFTPGSSVVMVHTGGLQGWTGFNERLQKKGVRF